MPLHGVAQHRSVMGQQEISTPGFRFGRRRVEPMARRRRRFLLIAVALSVGVHLAAALVVVLVPRLLPKVPPPPGEQGSVELLMVEQKGAAPSLAGQPKNSAAEPRPPKRNDTLKREDQKRETASPVSKAPAPPAAEPGSEPAQPPAEPAETKDAEATPARPPEKEAMAQPLPPRSQEAPIFDLGGTESESNAIALGKQIVPAMKDDRFRNRPPPYPAEAEMRGEHGSVTLVIHVSETGVATGADVQESSGYDVLDRAAINAVLKWHFRPAIKEGRAVPFNMPFRFIFEAY